MSSSSNGLQSIEVKYGLPAEVRFCARCTISNQMPNSTVEFKSTLETKKEAITFDEEGICSACRYSDIKDRIINWEQREKELAKLCDHYRSKTGQYDCIIPGSGGKDSSFTSHVLKYKYGMHPLTVTWAPHIYTDVGFSNFQKWIHSGMDNVLFTPNGKIHRLLTKLAFENLCHPFQPFIVGQRQIGPKFSALYEIPLVFYGENQAEYANSIEENNIPTMNPKFFGGDLDFSKIFLGGVSVEALFKEYSLTPHDLQPYLPVERERLEKAETEVRYLGYYLKWDPQECFYYASEHTGFQPNDERTEGSYSKYSSIDDRVDPFHYYTTLIKFGIGRATYDSSQEIRNKKITREEGVALVKKYDTEFPKKYFKEVLTYMNITEARFWEVIDNARSPHLWRLENQEWKLQHAVWMERHMPKGVTCHV